MRSRVQHLLASGLVLAMLGAGGLAMAHHSAAMWILEKRISVSGTVKSVAFRNPHGQMELTVTGPNGKATPWRVEMSAKNLLMRRGWKPDKVKVGDKVTVTGHPNKALPNEVYMREIKLADGSFFGDPEGKDKQLD